MTQRERRLSIAVVALVALLVLSGLRPYDRTTWWLEVAPVMIAIPVLLLTYRRFPLTPLVYGLIFVHASILMLGGAYTYARVPLGFWMKAVFQTTRNPYDKLGHFAQGFVPALIAREVLIRGRYVRTRRMTAFLALCVVMTVSACYELVEWLSAVLLGGNAADFLGTQGDPWDTQSDMAFALLGGVCSLVLLSRLHDRQIRALGASAAPGEDRAL